MYNKIYRKILDSSIWLQDDPTRIVWITCLAAMDEDGFVEIRTVENLANRARVSLENCRRAVEILESPEPETATEDDDGRRIERVPGGWMVLKAKEYSQIVKREHQKALTRDRVQRFRERLKKPGDEEEKRGNALRNAPLRSVTPSDTDTDTVIDINLKQESISAREQITPTASIAFEYEANITLICEACPKRTSPVKTEKVFMEAAHCVAHRDRIKIPVEQAATWLMGRALLYYQLVRDTWGEDFKYCKTPQNFFADRIYDEDPALWDRAKPAEGGKQDGNNGRTRANDALRTALSGISEEQSNHSGDSEADDGSRPANKPGRFADIFASFGEVRQGPANSSIRASGAVAKVVGFPGGARRNPS